MKVTKRERMIVLGAVAICLLMALYPPFVQTLQGAVVWTGYRFLWSGGGAVDFGRLVLQWLAVILVAGGLVYWERSRRR